MRIENKAEAVYVRLGQSYDLHTMKEIISLCDRFKRDNPKNNIAIDCSQLISLDHLSGELFSLKKQVTDTYDKILAFVGVNSKIEGILKIMYEEIVGEEIMLFKTEEDFRSFLQGGKQCS